MAREAAADAEPGAVERLANWALSIREEDIPAAAATRAKLLLLDTPLRLNTVPVFPGSTVDLIVQGTNPGMWHFHDHSELASTNNGQFPGGMMTMIMYEDAAEHGVKVPGIVQVSS